MKKLSILIALFLCATIGGVYATWSYAGSTDIVDQKAEAMVTVTDATTSGANGTYVITTNLVMEIDQESASSHKAVLKFASKDSNPIQLKIVFTPSAHAPLSVKNGAVASKLYFATTTPMQYKMDADGNYSATGTPVDVFKFTNNESNKLDIPAYVEGSSTNKWEKQSDGTFVYTMNENELKAAITLSQDFILDLKTEHDAFSDAVNGNIVCHISDGQGPTA
jgi:hypothetical protein